jgi:hypothetical protein
MYYNGIPLTITCTSGTSTTALASSAVLIGKYYGGGYNTSGFMDDFRVYNRALSASEIQALYNAEK